MMNRVDRRKCLHVIDFSGCVTSLGEEIIIISAPEHPGVGRNHPEVGPQFAELRLTLFAFSLPLLVIMCLRTVENRANNPRGGPPQDRTKIFSGFFWRFPQGFLTRD